MQKEVLEVVKTAIRKKREKGVTIVEYCIMLAIVAIAVATAGPTIKTSVLAVFSRASSVMLNGTY